VFLEIKEKKLSVNNQMNNDQINNLILTISRLQISLNQTQQELNQVRSELSNNNQNAPDPPRQQPTVVEEREGLRVGDKVRKLNGVRISGSVRNSRNVEGSIIRFTGNYVIIRVNLTPTRAGVERYQDVRRAFHNVERLSRIGE